MELVRIDDYQSWGVRGGGAWVVVDPWLVGEVSIGGGLLFRRAHRAPPAFTPETLPRPDALVVTAHFGDHLVVPTLRALPRDVPVFTTPQAAGRLRRLGYADVRVLAPGAGAVVDGAAGGLAIRAVAPDAPYRTSSLGLVFEEPATGARAYLETHVVPDAALDAVGRVDAVIVPVERVRLFGTTFAMDGARAAEVAERLAPQVLLPTGLAPAAAQGLLPRWFLACDGTVADCARALAARAPHVALRLARPGEVVPIRHAASATAASAGVEC